MWDELILNAQNVSSVLKENNIVSAFIKANFSLYTINEEGKTLVDIHTKSLKLKEKTAPIIFI